MIWNHRYPVNHVKLLNKEIIMEVSISICWVYIWADGFSGVPRISPVLGGTVSGSTFRWHLSHLFLDPFLLLVEAGTDLEKDD